jgi:UDP-N-acetylglucosamine 2-epimerase (non-hydrolysing)
VKVLTILGTRPEIIRLSLIIEKLDKVCNQYIVHTGQSYDYELDKIFFEELGVREPDVRLDAKGTFAEQTAAIFIGLEKVIAEQRPDKCLVLGDTNSGLGAIVAKRMGVPVYHMEAGNRCHDDRVPEEVNRKLIDHCSDVLLPYTQNSKQYLLAEGIPGNRIFVTGNPIYEVIKHFAFEKGRPDIKEKEYALVTMHRAETVDNEGVLREIISVLQWLTLEKTGIQVIYPVHPRTRKRIEELEIDTTGLDIRKPMGFHEFIDYQRQAALVITDSGTVQEEASIFGRPTVVIRDSTERPETQEAGNVIVAGRRAQDIKNAIHGAFALHDEVWTPPAGYMDPHVSGTVAKILLSTYRGL